MSIIFIAFEIIGTIAFAISGVLEGFKHDMDLFGVTMLGLTTAVGGGVLRDVIIGNTPPAAFRTPYCAVIAIVVSVIGFLIFYHTGTEFTGKTKRRMEGLLFYADTIGLAAFTVLGIEATIRFDASYNTAVLLFVGVITGIGGGILRDVLAETIPYVFKKHIYALASILGAVIMIVLLRFVSRGIAALCGFAAVIALRVLAATLNWNLPRAKKKKITADP
jgi:Predicted membrane protein